MSFSTYEKLRLNICFVKFSLKSKKSPDLNSAYTQTRIYIHYIKTFYSTYLKGSLGAEGGFSTLEGTNGFFLSRGGDSRLLLRFSTTGTAIARFLNASRSLSKAESIFASRNSSESQAPVASELRQCVYKHSTESNAQVDGIWIPRVIRGIIFPLSPWWRSR